MTEQTTNRDPWAQAREKLRQKWYVKTEYVANSLWEQVRSQGSSLDSERWTTIITDQMMAITGTTETERAQLTTINEALSRELKSLKREFKTTTRQLQTLQEKQQKAEDAVLKCWNGLCPKINESPTPA